MVKAYPTEELLAPAKLNLRLKVVGRRPNGYHELSMLNCSISLYDRLRITITDSPGIKLGQLSFGRAFNRRSTTDLEADLRSPERNLALRAAALFLERGRIEKGASIDLHKEIPSGAGLGGGSSDAAAVLRFLRARLRPEMPQEEIYEMALSLGTDLPFCLHSSPALISGIGERVTPLPDLLCKGLRGYPVKLFIPSYPIATVPVYQKHRTLFPDLASAAPDPVAAELGLGRGGIGGVLSAIENDLEPTASLVEPRIAALLRELRSTLKGFQVALTGSGSAIFALPLDPAFSKPNPLEVGVLTKDCETFDLFIAVD